ncbi:MAG: hypothetical protein GY866_23505 [Proteobacteria bacterium]|nr:hypothetical protein [Pseudomonadota bacterium]
MLEKICKDDDSPFTAEEHAMLNREERGKTVFKSKETLLRSYLPTSLDKLASLGFLFETIQQHRYRNILSFGSGYCVLEYLLKLSLPEDTTIVASDFDPFTVEKSRLFFPEIITERFDFFHDKYHDFQNNFEKKFDIAIFFGSSYVMNNDQFIDLFGTLKRNGVERIVDLQPGYMDGKQMVSHLLRPILKKSGSEVC